MTDQYLLLDSGEGKKVERFGDVVLLRPCTVALWDPINPFSDFHEQIDAEFVRSDETGVWKSLRRNITDWVIEICNIKFKLKLTPFGHTGLFPEHIQFWQDLRDCIVQGDRILNLFAYTGGVSLVAAECGGTIVHVDSSKAAIRWAKENFELNGFRDQKIFWILEDVMAFLKRELRRSKKYEVIVADPPTYGRGVEGEVFKIDRDLKILITQSVDLLADNAKFLLVTSHTPGHTPLMLERLLKDALAKRGDLNGRLMSGEVLLGNGDNKIPAGAYVKWMS